MEASKAAGELLEVRDRETESLRTITLLNADCERFRKNLGELEANVKELKSQLSLAEGRLALKARETTEVRETCDRLEEKRQKDGIRNPGPCSLFSRML